MTEATASAIGSKAELMASSTVEIHSHCVARTVASAYILRGNQPSRVDLNDRDVTVPWQNWRSVRELLGDARQPGDVRRPVDVGQVRDARRQPGGAVDALAQHVG